jgi:hypothetical protein
MRKQNQDELRSIRHAIAESNLPTLTGTIQDIEWAKTIRIELLMEANSIIARLHQEMPEGDTPHAELEDAILASRRLREATPAAWWIARSNTDADTLLRELAHRSYAMEYGRN